MNSPSATSPFLYLLNAMEATAQAENPFERGYPEKRRAVLEYVAKLEATRSETAMPYDQAAINWADSLRHACKIADKDMRPSGIAYWATWSMWEKVAAAIIEATPSATRRVGGTKLVYNKVTRKIDQVQGGLVVGSFDVPEEIG